MNSIVQALIIILATSTPAIAEVMDKELSYLSIWVVAVFCSAFGFAAARFNPKYTILSATVALAEFGGVVLELHDSSVGKAIQAEEDSFYPAQVYSAIAIIVISHIIGFVLRKNKQHRIT